MSLNDLPPLSVVIPSYNKASYLTETMESVLTQDFQGFEIIVVNDGSPDNTDEVVQSIKQKYPSHIITLLKKKSGGISDARNFGIAHARARMITTLDGDDLMKQGYLSQAMALLNQPTINMVSCRVELFGAQEGEWQIAEYDPFFQRYQNNIPTLVTYRKDLWEKTGGYKRALPFNEDWEFFVACEKHGLKVAQIKEKLFKYRVTADGLADQYIKDTPQLSPALIRICNEDRYPVQETLAAHEILSKMPSKWSERFKKQNELHLQEWILKFLLGLAAEGRNDPGQAIEFYKSAVELSNHEGWQPLYRLFISANMIGQGDLAKSLLHAVRTLRPDMTPVVQQLL